MIVCAGEALIDMLPRDLPDGGTAFAPHPGGSVMNTAVAAARLGARTGFVSGLSTDLFGKVLTDHLDGSGVDRSAAVRSGRPTTLAFVTLQDGHAAYAFYDENTAGRMLSPEDMPDLPDGAAALFCGGISLPVEPCGTAYEALFLRSGGVARMIDPNVRTSFVADEGAFRARMDRMLAAADVVKVSDEDLRWLTGERDMGRAAGAMRAKGPALVCVTEGAKGATGHWAGDPVQVPAARAEVVDTVGAGDTFNAGVLVALSEAGLLAPGLPGLSADDVRAALSLGAVAAAVTVSRAGANPPWRDEL
ncbi:fructokinase [Hasllibacter halocynthiae]|uniref:Fructokinase n=1 Tax=Hasllibacter halocynthiae TaxID=595589 RepID=A0A2T0X6I3_9RHOB|nr:carbohydrate kinase [Hasllibacter halocynthiae]PRY94537.1 fructokinase [Hasllibacter halocynthiae]